MQKENQILLELLNGVDNWADLKPRLEQFNTSQTETTTKKTLAGKVFEVFAKYYFQTEPKKTELYENVWFYDDVPLEIKNQLRLPSVDHGIDILLQDYEKRFYAVQCKFKNDETKSLSWSGDKIANVFALGTNCDKVIVFTNVSDITQVAKSFEQKFELLAFDELISIEEDIFENIYLLAKGNQPKELEKYSPQPHQEIAITKVLEHFESNERGQLILPCGAGKSLTSLWIKEKINPETTLVLVPSLALLKQIKNDWSRHKNDHFKYLCICSEKDIDKDQQDAVNVHTYEIGGPVTTDPLDVKAFLKKSGNKVIYSTYQSIGVISEACRLVNEFQFELVICDEAHRTAGSKNKNTFTLVHDNANIPALKRLYMTATPKVVSTKLKSRLGEDYELLCDMSNPDVYGLEAFRMSFGQAIDEGILVDYKIIGIGVTDKQIKKFIEERNFIGETSIDELAHNFSLDLVMNKHKAFHAISFHSKVKFAQDFAIRHKQFFETIFSESVNGKQTTTYRARVLRDFKNSEIGLVTNARCLTEGVDVPTIDLIYFCDPKTSKIDIVQASGRALRTNKAKNKELGFIVVPIFHHIDEDVEKEIKKKPIFDHLIQVIRSLCDQDERLQAEINDIAFKKGKKSNSKIQIDFSDDETEKIVKLEGLEKKVRDVLFDEIIEKTRVFWDVMFKQLLDYKETNGHTNVSRREDGMKQLGNWILEQRRQYHNGNIKPDKKKKLKEIGFDWKGENRREITDLDEIWKQGYVKLEEYFNQNGNSNVPARYEVNKSLGTWVVSQRVKFDNGKHAVWQIDLLEKLNFEWDPKNKFEEYFTELINFNKENGHLRVPTQGNDKYKVLGRWVNKLRVVYNGGKFDKKGDIVAPLKGRIRSSHLQRLNDIGFVWKVGRGDWNTRFTELQTYFRINGNSNVSQSEDISLYNWCYRIKKNPKSLSKERLAKLKSLNFDFTLRAAEDKVLLTWTERIEQLNEFFEENGNYNIPKDSNKYKTLVNWLRHQRSKQLKNKLTIEQLDFFKEINFSLEDYFSNEESVFWDENLLRLQKLNEDTGSFYIASNDTEFGSTLNWLRYQKSLYKQGLLPKDRIDKLKAIGYSFDIRYRGKKGRSGVSTNNEPDENWHNRYEELKKYYIENDTFLIPQKDSELKTLASWVRYQKSQFRKALLGDTKTKLLSEIKFPFNENFRGKTLNSIKREFESETNSDKLPTWDIKFEELKNYYETNGTFRIPSDDNSLQPLASWVRYQRLLYKEDKLDIEKIERLTDIGYSFELDFRGRKPLNEDSNYEDWETRLLQLESYYLENGTFHIKGSDTENADLLQWLRYQRILKNKGKLSLEQLSALEKIGYSFEIKYYGQGREKKIKEEKQKKPSNNIQSWETNYMKLLDYKMTTGHCNVPRSFEDKTLVNFVSRQRYIYRKGNLPQEQIKKLEFLGFEWEVERKVNFIDAWMEKYTELSKVFNDSGSCFVSKKDNKPLSNWIIQQRVKRKKDSLTNEQIKLLGEIKFDWEPETKGGSPDDEQWFLNFQQLELYKEKFGHCNVSQIDKVYKKLGRWLNDQRVNYSRGKLLDHRKDLLEELGVIWNVKEHEWNIKLQMLKVFYQKYGHFDVKQNDKEFGGLYNLLFKIKKKGTSKERKISLEEIGLDTNEILTNKSN